MVNVLIVSGSILLMFLIMYFLIFIVNTILSSQQSVEGVFLKKNIQTLEENDEMIHLRARFDSIYSEYVNTTDEFIRLSELAEKEGVPYESLRQKIEDFKRNLFFFTVRNPKEVLSKNYHRSCPICSKDLNPFFGTDICKCINAQELRSVERAFAKYVLYEYDSNLI